jgi:adhesin/invasin
VLPLPTQANGLQVLLGVTPLPILYTSSGQMNVQVPYSVPLNTQYQLSVVSGTSLSVPQTLTVAAAVPGIFTVNEQGSGQGVIVKSDGLTLAQPGTPAAIGETITIYCTGLGKVNPAATEGAPPTTAATTVSPVTATIGGVNAAVAYAGVTPGFPGLYQVNAVVPKGITVGDNVQVQLSIAGQTSQAVTMSVR